MAGSIKAFVRPQPQQQAQYLSLKHLIEANEFTGQRALVVGGSRGLGEVAAKILCSGGAQVKITYYQGKDDADRIVDEITSNGGAAGSFHLDVLNPGLNFSEAGLNGWNPTHLYYFATPFISAALKGAFSPALFTKFCNCYVAGFLHTVQPLQRRGLRNIFYPSTVFIDDPPANMGEYAAAKMAGEMVCRFLQKNYAGMTIHVPRLPRMATDQTVSLWPSNNLDPVTVMIEALRRFQDKSASTRR
jgi:NAD(P)-dependent dehydrogenase (short-subunit alcohol dehydrogenase family)